jgi:cation:H+ antiporter
MWHLIAFAGGILALYFGAEWLVRGAARLARSFGMSALVVGLTIVAIGTSAPELLVSLLAAARGQVDMTVGNVVGSNISNIALILGIAAVIQPISIRTELLGRGVPLMILATVGFALLALDGGIGRGGGALLLGGLVLYFWLLLRSSRSAAAAEAQHDAYQREVARSPGEGSRLRNAGLATLGLLLLAAGAHLLVGAATVFAARMGLSDFVIGITVVAVGTSLPELATSVLAALRKQADIAIGNAVGSNALNILGVLGPTALLKPLAIAPSVLRFEVPVLVGVTLLLLPFSWTGRRIARWEGALLVLGYALFLVILLRRGTVGG